jgi:hypothetical protein
MVKRLFEALVLLQGALTESGCLWKGDVYIEVGDEPIGLFDLRTSCMHYARREHGGL